MWLRLRPLSCRSWTQERLARRWGRGRVVLWLEAVGRGSDHQKGGVFLGGNPHFGGFKGTPPFCLGVRGTPSSKITMTRAGDGMGGELRLRKSEGREGLRRERLAIFGGGRSGVCVFRAQAMGCRGVGLLGPPLGVLLTRQFVSIRVVAVRLGCKPTGAFGRARVFRQQPNSWQWLPCDFTRHFPSACPLWLNFLLKHVFFSQRCFRTDWACQIVPCCKAAEL